MFNYILRRLCSLTAGDLCHLSDLILYHSIAAG